MNSFSGADLFEKGTNMRRMSSYLMALNVPPHLLYAGGTVDVGRRIIPYFSSKPV